MDLISTVIPLALVVGLSPLPIMPAVLILMTPRARSNAAAFLAAWLVALTAVVGVAALITGAPDPDPVSDEGIGWIQVVTGAAFLVLAALKWLRRPRPGDAKEQPAWMAALDSYMPRQAARLGALLAAANPKNLVMALAAGAEIALLATSPVNVAAAIAVFVVVGSLGVGTPIVMHRMLGDRAQPALARMKDWLDRNSTALSVGVLVVLGVLLLAGGLTA
jgi:threonine/homoserine/homoserine lactone efflux protein